MKIFIALALLVGALTAQAGTSLFILNVKYKAHVNARNANVHSFKANMIGGGGVGVHTLNFDDFDEVIVENPSYKLTEGDITSKKLELITKLADSNKVKITNCDESTGEIKCYGLIE